MKDDSIAMRLVFLAGLGAARLQISSEESSHSLSSGICRSLYSIGVGGGYVCGGSATRYRFLGTGDAVLAIGGVLIAAALASLLAWQHVGAFSSSSQRIVFYELGQ